MILNQTVVVQCRLAIHFALSMALSTSFYDFCRDINDTLRSETKRDGDS